MKVIEAQRQEATLPQQGWAVINQHGKRQSAALAIEALFFVEKDADRFMSKCKRNGRRLIEVEVE